MDDSNGTTIYLRFFFVHRTVVMRISSGLELGVHKRFVEAFKRLEGGSQRSRGPSPSARST